MTWEKTAFSRVPQILFFHANFTNHFDRNIDRAWWDVNSSPTSSCIQIESVFPIEKYHLSAAPRNNHNNDWWTKIATSIHFIPRRRYILKLTFPLACIHLRSYYGACNLIRFLLPLSAAYLPGQMKGLFPPTAQFTISGRRTYPVPASFQTIIFSVLEVFLYTLRI